MTAASRAQPARLGGPELFGSTSSAFERLADVERTAKLIDAVTDVVRPGDRVLELGTGTGILSLAAARAGAEAVDAYELSASTAATARRNVAANGYASVVQVIEEDVTSCRFSGPYDVVIAELISVGLVASPLVPAFNNLVTQGVLAPDVRMVPSSRSTFIELVDADDELFGFHFPMIQIEQTWQERRVRDTMTELRLVAHPDFTTAAREVSTIDERALAIIDLKVMHTGRANALRMTSMSHLAPGIDSGWTQCMNSPALIPVESRELAVATTVGIDLSYRMGSGFSSLRFDWSDSVSTDLDLS
ncbi:MAG: 50S ribosomal protein L11 methyltransferase [Acidimicrobiales bacterium]